MAIGSVSNDGRNDGLMSRRWQTFTSLVLTTNALMTRFMSGSDMLVTFKRLLHNRPYMLNTISGIFYVFGYMPYWTYTPKYLETQYHQSASTARLVQKKTHRSNLTCRSTFACKTEMCNYIIWQRHIRKSFLTGWLNSLSLQSGDRYRCVCILRHWYSAGGHCNITLQAKRSQHGVVECACWYGNGMRHANVLVARLSGQRELSGGQRGNQVTCKLLWRCGRRFVPHSRSATLSPVYISVVYTVDYARHKLTSPGT